jgi:hypothetical protein
MTSKNDIKNDCERLQNMPIIPSLISEEHRQGDFQADGPFHRTGIHTLVAVPTKIRVTYDRLFTLLLSKSLRFKKNVNRAKVNATSATCTFFFIDFGWHHTCSF